MSLRWKLLAFAPALLLCVTGAARDSVDRIPAQFSDPSRTGLLRVDLVNGRVSIVGSDTKSVLVESRVSSPDVASQQHKRPELHELSQLPSIVVREAGNKMSITSADPNITTNLEIHVPKLTNLQLSTVNEGDIRVEDVFGELEIGSVNGTITLVNVGGTVLAHTNNGQIAANLVSATADKPMAFTSLNGLLDITLPAATKATLTLRTDNGMVNSDFRLRSLTGAALSAEESGHVAEQSKAISGAINGGGAQIELRTFNGDVYLHKGP